MELAMPHLVLASQAQWLRELAHTRRPDGGPPGALAIVDRMGWLHVAAPGFADCMCAEWPGWRGPQLPEALHCSLSRAARFDGRAITVRARPHGDLIVVDVTHRGPLDRLSPREAEIARRWCRGDSYKAIARDLEVAPTTVRHHLRSIYAKLGVASKAALAQLASAGR
jgi:DNA-binding CsgD family transcriptional regulator